MLHPTFIILLKIIHRYDSILCIHILHQNFLYAFYIRILLVENCVNVDNETYDTTLFSAVFSKGKGEKNIFTSIPKSNFIPMSIVIHF